MISLNIFKKILHPRLLAQPSTWFYFTIFLLPVQLSYHLWPAFARVSGFRIDYLSPSLFLTDLTVIALLITWFFSLTSPTHRQRILHVLGLPWGAGLLILFSINIFFSFIPQLSLVHSLHLLELYFFARYIITTADLDLSFMLSFLKYAILYTALIGIFQFAIQSSLNGYVWWLGERTFTVSTPGIATVTLDNQLYLRAYSTFSHPNSFAGFLLVSLVLVYGQFLFFQMNFKDHWHTRDLFILISGITALVLTFSRTALLTLVFLGLIAIVKIFFRYSFKIDVIFAGFASLLFPATLLSIPSLYQLTAINFLEKFLNTLSVQQRIIQYRYTLHLFASYAITGVGFDNYIPALTRLPNFRPSVNLLQPVHNLPWLAFAEVGLIGLIFCLITGYYLFRRHFPQQTTQDKSFIVAAIAILATSATDHYWYTLQQNQLLAILVIALLIRNSRSTSPLPSTPLAS